MANCVVSISSKWVGKVEKFNAECVVNGVKDKLQSPYTSWTDANDAATRWWIKNCQSTIETPCKNE